MNRMQYENRLRNHPDPRDPEHPESDCMERISDALYDHGTAAGLDDILALRDDDLRHVLDYLYSWEEERIFREFLEEGDNFQKFWTTNDPAELIAMRDGMKSYIVDKIIKELEK